MHTLEYGDFRISVTNAFDSGTGESLLEFRKVAPADQVPMSIAIIVPENGSWADARISIDPISGSISVELLVYLLEVAKNRYLA